MQSQDVIDLSGDVDEQMGQGQGRSLVAGQEVGGVERGENGLRPG